LQSFDTVGLGDRTPTSQSFWYSFGRSLENLVYGNSSNIDRGDSDAIAEYCLYLVAPYCTYKLCCVNVKNRVLPCMLTAVLGTTKITQKHTPLIN